jgi:hypothetical protein
VQTVQVELLEELELETSSKSIEPKANPLLSWPFAFFTPPLNLGVYGFKTTTRTPYYC